MCVRGCVTEILVCRNIMAIKVMAAQILTLLHGPDDKWMTFKALSSQKSCLEQLTFGSLLVWFVSKVKTMLFNLLSQD